MTDSNDNKLLALRPELRTEPSENIAENFQNKTLRPILKLQNNTLIRVFKAYIIKYKNQFGKLSISEKHVYINTALRQDVQLRHFLRGIIAGHFTEAEWEIFALNENEVNKRMIKLIEQRLVSQLDTLSF